MKEKRIVNNLNNYQERVFLDSNVLLTAVCDKNSDSAKLLQMCKEREFIGIISNEILKECHHKLRNHPELQEEFNELVHNLEIIKISDRDTEKYTSMITDSNDRHVLAGAEVGCADYLITLDWKHFLSSSAKKRLAEYPIPTVFPGILTSAFRKKQLPKIKIYTAEGTFAIGVDPQWNSEIIKNAGRPFFVLDFPGIFSIWYEPTRFQIKMRTEVYKSNEVLTFPRYINVNDAFLCIVTWSAIHGFSCMVDEKLKRITQRWHKIPTKSVLWIGSDRNGANQINSLLVFHGWSRALTEKEMRRIFEGGYVTLPEKPASL